VKGSRRGGSRRQGTAGEKNTTTGKKGIPGKIARWGGTQNCKEQGLYDPRESLRGSQNTAGGENDREQLPAGQGACPTAWNGSEGKRKKQTAPLVEKGEMEKGKG